MIPLYHDFAGQTVLVVGGGPVGARKARRFAAEATVVVVSPTFAADRFTPADAGGEDGGTVQRIRAALSPEDVDDWISRTGPALVVAATDDAALNDAIAAAARERGIRYNRADASGDRPVGSVVVPATVRDDPVSVAVSTSGRSPALSAELRDRIADELANSGAMADLTADLRAELRAADVPADERRAAMRAVVGADSVWKALDSGRSNARQVATDVIADVTGDPV